MPTKKSITWTRRSEAQKKRWEKVKGATGGVAKLAKVNPPKTMIGCISHIPGVLEELKKEEKVLTDSLQVVRDLITAIQMFQGLK